MIYKRTFWVQASHFNNAETYITWRDAQQSVKSGDWESACKQVASVLKDCHGHNFKVEVETHGDTTIDNKKLKDIIQEWDNTNLSILPEFDEGLGDDHMSLRWMCESLLGKLYEKFGQLVQRGSITAQAKFKVRIWETPFTYAEADWTK